MKDPAFPARLAATNDFQKDLETAAVRLESQ
jgi:hypothetical protein